MHMHFMAYGNYAGMGIGMGMDACIGLLRSCFVFFSEFCSSDVFFFLLVYLTLPFFTLTLRCAPLIVE